MKKILVAVLDSKSRLIGLKHKVRPKPDDHRLPDGCDLPLDGSYKLMGDTFVPLGHGIGEPGKPPITTEAVLFSMIQALTDLASDAVPADVRKWANWYRKFLRDSEDEIKEARLLRAKRRR